MGKEKSNYLKDSYIQKKLKARIIARHGELNTEDKFMLALLGTVETLIKRLIMFPPLFLFHRWLIGNMGLNDWLILMFLIVILFKN